MNKVQLIEQISVAADISKVSAGRALDAFVGAIIDTLQKDEPVVLAGFGTFLARARAARKGRNPQNGEVIEIKAAKIPTFKAGKLLKDAMNASDESGD